MNLKILYILVAVIIIENISFLIYYNMNLNYSLKTLNIENVTCISQIVQINESAQSYPYETQVCNCGQELQDCYESWDKEVQTLFEDLNTCCDYCGD